MFILKHGTREDKPFLRYAIIGVTGLDISCSEEKKALRFVSRGGCRTGWQGFEGFLWELLPGRGGVMLELYFVYNGHCKFFLGTFDNVDDLIEQMEDHQWAFSAITHPRFQKHIGQRTTRFDYGAKDCYYLATFSGGEEND